MAIPSGAVHKIAEDPVSDVLKWILLAVAVGTFGVLFWTIDITYKAAPPFPDRFVSPDGVGEDYTASNLVRLATLTEANIAQAKTGRALSDLSLEEQAAVKAHYGLLALVGSASLGRAVLRIFCGGD